MQKKPRILVVDDDYISISILATILQESYDISIALNGEQALHVTKNEPNLDLVLLDVQMPDMDGYQVCTALKQNPITKDIPVIFITASDSEDEEKKGLELGAVDYITKPFRPSIVQMRLRNHLELKQQRDFLRHLSCHDGLTGIYNRNRFNHYLNEEWHRALRNQSSLSLIILDVDKFKQFNDFYGHVAGDDCLKKIAMTITDALERNTDLAARYGGEEFVCVLPATDNTGAVKIAEKIRTSVYQLQIVHELSVAADYVTVSLGVATTTPQTNDTIAGFIEAADKMLYLAKSTGRNKVVYTDANEN